jgi:phosphoribosyl-ATP pyrophosphohydrolase/phosphoribosyl-AMP cyclohydrolase
MINFSKSSDGLIPAIIQDIETQKVLMLGFMNKEALDKTYSTKRVTFFSRSKNRLWEKGETSGNYLKVVEIKEDCDNDTLLIKARPAGPICHTGADTCFNEENENNFLYKLQKIIQNRKKDSKGDSYTNKLFNKGINKIAQKVGEEAVELVIEAKDDNKELFLGEAADLMYHYLVLLTAKNFTLDDVIEVLKKRSKV